MRLSKISLLLLCLTLSSTFPGISFSEEGLTKNECLHISTAQPTSLNANCACNALLDTLNLLGIKTTSDEISTLLPVDKDGLTSMHDLLEAAKTKGLKPKALKLTYEELTKVKMPVIAHLNTNHFITLKEAKGDGIISIENNKEPFIPKDEFLGNYSGYCLTFNPNIKGTVLSNTKLKRIKGSHCTCGGCTSSDCNTGSCGGSKSCSSSNCTPGSSCPGGGICLFCPDKSSPVCGGQAQPCGCLAGTNCATSICPEYCDSLTSCPTANCEKIDCSDGAPKSCKVRSGDSHYSHCEGSSAGTYHCEDYCYRDSSEPSCVLSGDWGTWCCGGCGRSGVTWVGCPATRPGDWGCENESTNPPGHCRDGMGSCGIVYAHCNCSGSSALCYSSPGIGNCGTCSYHITECNNTNGQCRGSGGYNDTCRDCTKWWCEPVTPGGHPCGVPGDCHRTQCAI